MEFTPAGEIIGAMHQVRTVKIAGFPQLPDGEFSFVDLHCTNPACDCRKTIIQVIHKGRVVSMIDYGWETPEYYRKWMGDDDAMATEMAGASISMESPDLVRREAILKLFEALMNERWKMAFKHHYALVKERLAARSSKGSAAADGREEGGGAGR
ncbi:MAG: hypothetical protein KF833_22100 [Verrucomicrobiae bacterium]|nr:hypothetical protein [Verrucomicrobiae bacterium]